ncbi:polyketide cyclase / dehydrase and lipid transport [Mycobacterium sp. NPDC050853]|uniref:polyketide cyclase / dehydrase and lipid transport n=1 Tax=Mycobacteriaceae TaxID=1762 RepID=UPI0015DD84AD|nr:polyketide cyclase / dehydrase and lipid transport [Mycobacteroides sp. LB1]
MNSIQVADQTFIAADPVDIGRAVSNSADWRRWWPDLQLNAVEERGEKGIRWTVAGPLTGTMEVWLEPVLDGAILHYFLHAEPSGASAAHVAKLNLAKLNHARRIAGKRFAFGIKQQLEAGRPIGEARVRQA